MRLLDGIQSALNPQGADALVVAEISWVLFAGAGRWAQAQRRPAAGANALFAAHCATCHAVRGTQAAGVLGPDLTHVGSRLTIGAGLLPNNAGALAGWIASNQHLKPGNLMPAFHHFSGAELRALAGYLESLK